MIYRTYNTEDKFYFLKMPSAFVIDEDLREMSLEAKYLFIILLEQSKRSRNMNWIDDEGRFYIVRTTTLVQKDLDCSYKKAIKALETLEAYGLIIRSKTAKYSNNRIYVSDITKLLKAKEELIDRKGVYTQTEIEKSSINGKSDVVKKAESYCQNDNFSLSKSDLVQESRIPDIYSNQSIKNNLSNSEILETIELIKLNTDYYTLCDWYGDGIIESIFNVIKSTLSSSYKDFILDGSVVTFLKLKERFMILKEKHIRYIHECFIEKKEVIMNPKAYMLTMIYQSTDTFDTYYANKVNAEQGV
ncbi:MAG: replication initiator protein A [Clostridiales bacterium]|nr:replication initiator protein A [Clostridiales bacterium]